MADIKPLFYKCVDIFLGCMSARIMVVSSAVGDSIAIYAPWLRKRMSVLYNGVKIPENIPTHQADSKIRLLTVGSLTPKKDHIVLIEAMKILPEQFTLTIAGSGSLFKTLSSSVQESNLVDRVTFLGTVQPENVTDLYRTHDIFVLPSQREGCPNVVSEAQSFALPVVAFDIPGMREFVDDTCGVLVKKRSGFELASRIKAISATPEQLRAVGVSGYHRVSLNRDYFRQFNAYLSLLSSIL
jgi:glycosyltransferase involved in cell wall biosynthesis